MDLITGLVAAETFMPNDGMPVPFAASLSGERRLRLALRQHRKTLITHLSWPSDWDKRSFLDELEPKRIVDRDKLPSTWKKFAISLRTLEME